MQNKERDKEDTLMKKRFKSLLAMFLVFAFILTGCVNSKKGDDKSSSKPKGEQTQQAENKGNIVGERMGGGVVVENEGTPIKGGTFRVGIPTDSPFKGIFNSVLYEDNIDWNIIGPTMYTTANAGPSLELRDSSAVKFEYDEKAKTATIKLQDNFKWNDGKPVTAKDIIINYLIVGHKDYPGVRYDDDMINIVGMEDYHAGKTKDISGVKEVDDKTVQISFKEFKPSIKWGAGIWVEPTNYEQVKDIPMKDLISSAPIRKNPKSAGPFYITNVVPGQSVEFSANEYFWGGKPKVDKVVMEVVPSSQILASLKAGKYDYIAGGAPSDTFKEISELKGYKVARLQDMAYTYIGFKLGKWDKEKGEVVVDPNAKMADVNLRKAMGYAIDNNAVGEKFYEGYRSQATSVIIPIFKEYFDKDLKGYNYDPEKSKKLLDDAGYKDVDNDGFREDKNGKPLVIKFASMSGGEVAEPLASYYVQAWKQVGLNVELTGGRLIEFNSFYDKLKNDDPEIDVFQGAWGTGTNPDPSGLFSKAASFNYYRYTNEDMQKALDKISASNTSDEERAQAYKDFEKVMEENVPLIPTLYREALMPVNKRVKKFDTRYVQEQDKDDFRWNQLELLADQPIKE